ncbi:MAG: hypothetical protein KDC38_06855 [Planctomycetes bacterium]|nr:hypothetical protein [Planctomycetota bacterium]
MTTKSRPTTWILGVIAIVALGVPETRMVRAAETMQFDETIRIDELGDATFAIRIRLNASQFQEWQQRYGMNPSLLRREICRDLTPYEIADFELDKNDLEREILITIAAKGVTRYLGDGHVEFDVPKEWKLVDKDGPELKFNCVEPLSDGNSIQHFITAELPPSATEVSDPVPAVGGDHRLTYDVPVRTGSSLGLLAGVPLLIVGIALTLFGFARGS